MSGVKRLSPAVFVGMIRERGYASVRAYRSGGLVVVESVDMGGEVLYDSPILARSMLLLDDARALRDHLTHLIDMEVTEDDL